MQAKQLKYLSLFEQMCKEDVLSEVTPKKRLPEFIALDFSLALDTWDYLVTAHEGEISADEQMSKRFGTETFELFYKKGATRAVKALCDLPSLRRAVYQYSPDANEGTPFAVLVDFLVASKVDPADEIFKCLVKNDRIDYGPFMKNLLERVFIEILKKNPSKRIEMPRKLAVLLLSYVSKIKTDERAMLEQRIRETM